MKRLLLALSLTLAACGPRVTRHVTCSGTFKTDTATYSFLNDVWDYDVGGAQARCQSTDTASGATSSGSATASSASSEITCAIQQDVSGPPSSGALSITTNASRTRSTVTNYDGGVAAVLGTLSCAAASLDDKP